MEDVAEEEPNVSVAIEIEIIDVKKLLLLVRRLGRSCKQNWEDGTLEKEFGLVLDIRIRQMVIDSYVA